MPTTVAAPRLPDLPRKSRLLTRSRRRTVLAALLVAAAAGGCALLEPAPDASAVPFDVLGRVAVSHDGRAFSANLRWRHDTAGGELWLMTPLGQTLAHVRTGPEGATLTAADGQQYRAASVEGLTRQALGWALPLSRLTWWIRGEPVPGAEIVAAARDERQRLRSLVQDEWRIGFPDYFPEPNAALPRRVELSGVGQTIRMIIDNWRVAGPGQ